MHHQSAPSPPEVQCFLPLHDSCLAGNHADVQRVVEARADVNALVKDSDGITTSLLILHTNRRVAAVSAGGQWLQVSWSRV